MSIDGMLSRVVSSGNEEESKARRDSAVHGLTDEHNFGSIGGEGDAHNEVEYLDGAGLTGPDGAGILSFTCTSTHLDPFALRSAIRCTSPISTEAPSERDVQGFLEQNRWNVGRSHTPSLAGSHVRQVSESHGTTVGSHSRQFSSRLPSIGGARPEVYSPSLYSTRASVDGPSVLDAVCKEWPLKPDEQPTQETEPCPAKSPPLSPVEAEDKPLPPTPESHSTRDADKSPPKRSVRKRRSIFRFLRPGSRKAIRSISSPVLPSRTSYRQQGAHDGPADEQDLLTVQYELTESPQHRRSVTVSHLSVPQERRGTLAEYYERRPTLGGNDRRRPSAVAVGEQKEQKEQRLQEISEDEDVLPQLQSSRLRRRLSRANALDEAGKSLMGQALKKHQQEKAMFRSESKRRESMAVLQQPSPAVLTPAAVSVATPSIQECNDESPTGLKTPSYYDQRLQLPAEGAAGPSSLNLTVNFDDSGTSKAMSTSASSTASPKADMETKTVASPSRIGSNLDSWTRLPSHTRSDRCGSAGSKDAVTTRDFAVAPPAEDIVVSPLSKNTTGSRKSKRSLIKSPSRTFSHIVRYYSDLFTMRDGYRGANRRTSVSASTGHVLHPELEMLPPVTGSEGYSHDHSHAHLKEIERRLEEGIPNAVHQHSETPQPTFNESSFKLGSTSTDFRHGSIFDMKQKVKSDDDTSSGGDAMGPMDGAADQLSKMYQSCLPSGPSSGASSTRTSQSRVRKFPSVTVTDDCMGHRASISLVANEMRGSIEV